MGRPSWETGYAEEQPVHPVNLDAFYMAKYEVTIGQYTVFLNAGGNDDHYHGGGYMDDSTHCGIIQNGPGDYSVSAGRENYPVVYVSWYDAVAYCDWLSAKTGETWRLPTEAEWEYAANGPNPHRTYPWGNTWDNTKLNNGEDYGSGSIDGYAYSAPVGMYESGKSPFGLYDMAGNVWEWCSDWYDGAYYSVSPLNNPQGPGSGSYKVQRGGSFNNNAVSCRLSYRYYFNVPGNFNYNLGFRPAKSVP